VKGGRVKNLPFGEKALNNKQKTLIILKLRDRKTYRGGEFKKNGFPKLDTTFL